MYAPGSAAAFDRPLSELTGVIIGCAVTVHRALGPGPLESSYQACLEYQLALAGLDVRSQVGLPLTYGRVRLDLGYRLDMSGPGQDPPHSRVAAPDIPEVVK